MVNITTKSNTLRTAIASATVSVSSIATVEAIRARRVPKGDVFEFSRAAGLLAIKKTSDVIPDCHPLPIEFASIHFEVEGLTVRILVEVKTIYKTGVEVEAMHGAAVVALTMYDMLKPIDKAVEIAHIKLVEKKGGKSDQALHDILDGRDLQCAVIVCSDTVSEGKAKDGAGVLIVEKLKTMGINSVEYKIISDDLDTIQSLAASLAQEHLDLVIFTGGTGVSPRDLTPDAIEPLLTLKLDGVMETARRYGQERMPFAMLSRGVAGFINNTLVVTLPGSIGGVEDTMSAIFPYLFHLFKVRKGERH